MEELTLQERFNQLLSFLKDPQAYPHPQITPEDFRLHLGENPKAGMWIEFRQGAIDIMESWITREGFLKGNRKTSDIPIIHLEDFILNAATNIQLAKWVIAKSPRAYDIFQGYGLFDGHPLVTPGEILEEHYDMMRAFYRMSYKLGQCGQIRIDRVRTIGKLLIEMLPYDLNKLNKHRAKAMFFDLVTELVSVFLHYGPEAPDNLIASHIFNFISKRQDSTLKGICLPGQDAIRKRVQYLRKKLTTTPTS